MVLVADDGQTHLIVPDDDGRMFYKDKRLHNRPLQVTASRVMNLPVLRIQRVQSVSKDKLLDVIYWCEMCALRYAEPGKCICCGSDVVLLEVATNDMKLKSPALIPLDP